jgi:ribosomal protein S18 acetylase RimI-like enzyme
VLEQLPAPFLARFCVLGRKIPFPRPILAGPDAPGYLRCGRVTAGVQRKDTLAELSVREANAEDAEKIHTLADELAGAVGDSPPGLEKVRERLAELLEEPRARVLMVEDDDGSVVGVVSLWIKPDLAHGDSVVEVPMLVVSEERRREGIGKLLMEEVQSLAAENGAKLIELVATTQNSAAREFYRSLGFVETDHVTLEFVGDVEDPPDPEEV